LGNSPTEFKTGTWRHLHYL